MGLFNFKKKVEVRDIIPVDSEVIDLIGQEYITNDKAMSVPTVAALVHLIAGTVATLPVELVSNDGIIQSDYRGELLNSECGDFLSSQEVKYQLIKDWILNGSAYYYVDWNGTKINRLAYLKPHSVGISSNGMNINREGFFTCDGLEIQPWQMGRLLRNTTNGMKGRGICQDCSEYIQLLINLQNLQSRASRTGGKLLIQPEIKLSADALQTLKNAWQRLYASDDAGSIMVLNSSVGVNQLQSQVAAETSNVETSSTDKIASALGVPSKILYGGATAQDYALFKNNCLVPLIRMLEASFNRFLLLEREKGSYEFRINTDGLSVDSLGERMAAYTEALGNSTMSINEVRRKENLPPLDKDYMHLSLASVLWDPDTGEVFNTNMSTKTNIEDASDPEEVKQDYGDQTK